MRGHSSHNGFFLHTEAAKSRVPSQTSRARPEATTASARLHSSGSAFGRAPPGKSKYRRSTRAMTQSTRGRFLFRANIGTACAVYGPTPGRSRRESGRVGTDPRSVRRAASECSVRARLPSPRGAITFSISFAFALDNDSGSGHFSRKHLYTSETCSARVRCNNTSPIRTS